MIFVFLAFIVGVFLFIYIYKTNDRCECNVSTKISETTEDKIISLDDTVVNKYNITTKVYKCDNCGKIETETIINSIEKIYEE